MKNCIHNIFKQQEKNEGIKRRRWGTREPVESQSPKARKNLRARNFPFSSRGARVAGRLTAEQGIQAGGTLILSLPCISSAGVEPIQVPAACHFGMFFQVPRQFSFPFPDGLDFPLDRCLVKGRGYIVRGRESGLRYMICSNQNPVHHPCQVALDLGERGWPNGRERQVR